MGKPLVSVVLGVLNGAKTIERCLDSLLRQSLTDWELVVKDGGSTDGTQDILKRHQHLIAHLQCGPDRGVYDAWNEVVPRCRGEWVCFLGCDDELAGPDALACVSRARNEHPDVDLICGLVALTEADGSFVRTLGAPWHWQQMKRRQSVAHAGMWHNARLFEKYGLFDADYMIAGDYEFLLRLGPDARAAFVDQVIVRMGINGMSQTHAARRIRETARAQAKHPSIGTFAAGLNCGYNLAREAVKRVVLSR